jgi:RNA polymerase sigma factor (sigma-70 family)
VKILQKTGSIKLRRTRISYDILQESLSSGGGDKGYTMPAEFTNFALRELLNDNLTKKQKSYIILYYKEGLTMEEIAQRFGVAKSTVSRTVQRGRERIIAGAKRQTLKKIIY